MEMSFYQSEVAVLACSESSSKAGGPGGNSAPSSIDPSELSEWPDVPSGLPLSAC